MDAIREEEDWEQRPSDEVYDRVEVAEEKLEAIESRLREFVSFDPKKTKSAGCYVTIDHSGRLFIERRARQEERREEAREVQEGRKGCVGRTS